MNTSRTRTSDFQITLFETVFKYFIYFRIFFFFPCASRVFRRKSARPSAAGSDHRRDYLSTTKLGENCRDKTVLERRRKILRVDRNDGSARRGGARGNTINHGRLDRARTNFTGKRKRQISHDHCTQHNDSITL